MAWNVCLHAVATRLTNSGTAKGREARDAFTFRTENSAEADLSGLNGARGLVKTSSSAAETLSTTLSKLCQQWHAANSWRYFDDDLFIGTTPGGGWGARSQRTTVRGTRPFAPTPLENNLFTGPGIKEAFDATEGWSSIRDALNLRDRVS